jgi:hypothetical protein
VAAREAAAGNRSLASTSTLVRTTADPASLTRGVVVDGDPPCPPSLKGGRVRGGGIQARTIVAVDGHRPCSPSLKKAREERGTP